jgi:hypothetical protein
MAKGILRHRDYCTHPSHAAALVDLSFCSDCKAVDTQAVDAFRAGMDWLSMHNEAPIMGIHFEEIADGKSSTDAPRVFSLIYDIAITSTLPPDDDAVRMLTITKAASGHTITCDHDLTRREIEYDGEACWLCIIEGMTSWPKNAKPVKCARHEAIEVTCSHCNGTGYDPNSREPADCPGCGGAQSVILDPVLMACQWLALDCNRAAEAQADHWLAFLVLGTAERRQWDIDDYVECAKGIAALTRPTFPWDGCSFASHAQAAIISAITVQLREGVMHLDELMSAVAATN